jgi:hypothetical protein
MHDFAQRTFYPCATVDPKYDTGILYNGLRL